jgi:hypothetical protein
VQLHDLTLVSLLVLKSARFEAWRLIKELYHNTGTAKLPAVTEYIKEMLKTKNKILVYVLAPQLWFCMPYLASDLSRPSPGLRTITMSWTELVCCWSERASSTFESMA